MSWLLAAWCLWNAMWKIGDTSLLFSRGEVEAIELLNKAYRIYEALPEWMQFRIDPKSKTELGFPMNKSSIRVFAATEAAGVSFTASRIICDEWEFHPVAESNYINAKPTIDAGGQFIGCTTVDKRRAVSLPKRVFLEAVAGENGFTPLFFPYDVRPGRDEQWYNDTKRSVPVDELNGLTPDLYMEQNYPRTIEEALSPSQSIAAIDMAMLEQLKTRCTTPLIGLGLDHKVCNIFQPFAVGQLYVAASDTGHGSGKDYNVTVVMNARTGVVVADILDNVMQADQFAWYSYKLLEHYRFPKWWPEDNDWGASLIIKAKELGYPNFGYQDEKRLKPGWHTHATGFWCRDTMMSQVCMAFNNCQITILNYKGLLQFSTLIRNPEKNGRIEARKGENDDYPTAVAICWAKCAETLKSDYRQLTPIKTLTFQQKPVVRSMR